VKKVVELAKDWCDISTVPVAERVPEKLRGLFWMQFVATSDLNVCFSLGRWDPATLTMVLHVYETFTWAANPQGFFAQQNMLGAFYYLKFESKELKKATITMKGRAPGSFVFEGFVKATMRHTMEERSSSNGKQGDRWFRRIADPLTGILTAPLLASYFLVRIADGDLKPTSYAPQFERIGLAKMLSRGTHSVCVMKCPRGGVHYPKRHPPKPASLLQWVSQPKPSVNILQ